MICLFREKRHVNLNVALNREHFFLVHQLVCRQIQLLVTTVRLEDVILRKERYLVHDTGRTHQMSSICSRTVL